MKPVKKLWGVRHIRHAYLSAMFWRWWYNMGKYLGAFPNESDLEYLEDVKRGKA